MGLAPPARRQKAGSDGTRSPATAPIRDGIQPHGILLVLDAAALHVLWSGGDTAAVFGVTPDRVPGSSLDALLGEDAARALRQAASSDAPSTASFEARLGAGVRVHLQLHRGDGALLLDIEPELPQPALRASPQPAVAAAVLRLRHASSEEELWQKAAEDLRALTGFDRVLIHRDARTARGLIVAEARDAALPPMLGTHCPALDDRQAYPRGPVENLRAIPDVGAPVTPLHAGAGLGDTALPPLHGSILRAVAAGEREALEGLGMRASLSVAIPGEGPAWGVIACHHRTPRAICAETRGIVLVIAGAAALRAAALERESEAVEAARLDAAARTALDAFGDEPDPIPRLAGHPARLLDLVPADGIAVFVGEGCHTAGEVPAEATLRALNAWLAPRMAGGLFLADGLADADAPDLPGGILALSLSPQSRDCIIWFRGTGGQRAVPWRRLDRETAKSFRVALLERLVRGAGIESGDRRDFLMAELDHRVKNTLASIQSLLQHSGNSASEIGPFVREFGRRLRAMSRAHTLIARSRWEGAALRALIEGSIAAQRSGEAQHRVLVEGPEIRLRPGAAQSLGLALHELATNAAKHGALSVPGGRIAVRWQIEGDRALLDWIESDGPPASPPLRRGFGLTVIERSLAHDLGGAVRMDFGPSGLRCQIAVPLDQVLDGGAGSAAG